MLALPSFLSRSRSSLHTSTDSPVAAAGGGGPAAPTTVRRMSSSVDSIAVSVYDLYKYGLWLRDFGAAVLCLRHAPRSHCGQRISLG